MVSVVCAGPLLRCAGNVHYYQGLHDVASVLLLVAGEPAAFEMLCQLSTGHLRDATRSSLDPVIELLGLMGPIVAAVDEELASHLSKQGLPPFYALSWFITWFSHDLADFGEVCAGKELCRTHLPGVAMLAAVLCCALEINIAAPSMLQRTAHRHHQAGQHTWPCHGFRAAVQYRLDESMLRCHRLLQVHVRSLVCPALPLASASN
jgi:hypothetical protein